MTEKTPPEELENHYLSQFTGRIGTIVFDDLKKECGWDSVMFEKDARFEAFLLGRRSIIRYIMDMMECKMSRGLKELPESYNEKEKNDGEKES